MANRYFNKATKTELLVGLTVPIHIRYDSENEDHVAIDESNPFFSTLPEGKQLVFVDDLPTVLENIPPFIPTVQQQAIIDLQDAGVTIQSLASARYLDSRGDSSLLTALDSEVDDVVTSSGLTLAEVIALIGGLQ